MVRRLLFVSALGLALYACKDDLVLPPPADPGNATNTSGGGGGGGGGNRDASTPTADGSTSNTEDAGACTSLTLAGLVTDENVVADSAPAGLGGQINDGTYNLTVVQFYAGASQLPGPSGNTFRSTFRITGGTNFERVVVLGNQAGAAQETRTRGVVTSVGVNATLSISCPAPVQEQLTYTANDTQLILTDLFTKRQWTYVRAP